MKHIRNCKQDTVLYSIRGQVHDGPKLSTQVTTGLYYFKFKALRCKILFLYGIVNNGDRKGMHHWLNININRCLKQQKAEDSWNLEASTSFNTKYILFCFVKFAECALLSRSSKQRSMQLKVCETNTYTALLCKPLQCYRRSHHQVFL